MGAGSRCRSSLSSSRHPLSPPRPSCLSRPQARRAPNLAHLLCRSLLPSRRPPLHRPARNLDLLGGSSVLSKMKTKDKAAAAGEWRATHSVKQDWHHQQPETTPPSRAPLSRPRTPTYDEMRGICERTLFCPPNLDGTNSTLRSYEDTRLLRLGPGRLARQMDRSLPAMAEDGFYSEADDEVPWTGWHEAAGPSVPYTTPRSAPTTRSRYMSRIPQDTPHHAAPGSLRLGNREHRLPSKAGTSGCQHGPTPTPSSQPAPALPGSSSS